MLKNQTWIFLCLQGSLNCKPKFSCPLFATLKLMDIEDSMDQLTENILQAGLFEAVKAIPSPVHQPWEECMPHVKAPVLVVLGKQDSEFPRPGDARVLIEGADPFPQTERPEKTAPALLNFHRQA